MSDEPRRRRLLRTSGLAVAAGLGGCLGRLGGGDGGDSGGGGNGGGGATTVEASSCTDLTAGYTQYDTGERKLTVDFEYPSVFGDLEYAETTAQVIVQGKRGIGDDETLRFNVTQFLDPFDGESEVEDPSEDLFLTEFTFDGETVTAVKTFTHSNPVTVQINMPHGDTYLRTLLRVEIDRPDSELGETCAGATEGAATHVLESFSPNPDTTYQSGGERVAGSGQSGG